MEISMKRLKNIKGTKKETDMINYNNWNEEATTEIQKHIWVDRRKKKRTEHGAVEITESEEQKTDWRKTRRAWGICEMPSNQVTYLLWKFQKEKREREKLFEEIIPENFPCFVKYMDIGIQEAQTNQTW